MTGGPDAPPIARGPRTGRLALLGFGILIVFFGAIVGWAGTAPLESAAMAPGVVGFSGFRKTIQHLEGGIVREILVSDGDHVAAGQILVRLDDTRARAALAALDAQQVATAALVARLRAEQAGDRTPIFPDWLLARAGESAVADALSGQRDLFGARYDAWRQQIDILRQRTAQYEEQIRGLDGEIAALERELVIVRRESELIAPLALNGILPRNRLTQLQRDQAQLEGSMSQNQAAVAAARQSIGELRFQAAELESRRLGDVADGLRTAQDRLRALDSEIAAARDMLARATIVAPIGGYVVDRRVHTSGGVVAPGAQLLDIVPDGGTLVIEARIDPKDRDVIAEGQDAWVLFTAFSQRVTSRLRGAVVSISADRFQPEQATVQQPYYRAVIELREDPRTALNGADIYPGMQAEVMIVTGRRSTLAYLLRPVLFGLQRALREA